MVTVYFDGLCRLCSAEIEHYRRQEGADKISFVDITAQNFDPLREGLDPHAVHKVLHVRSSAGEIKTGVDAFVEIWSTLPKFNWLGKVVGVKPVRWIAELGYIGFATLRPFLPRKKDPCAASPYCEMGDRKS
jgi:predicted DCC family thiol-disulfide oxidoreductase YuxK